MKASELREKSNEDLQKDLIGLLEEQFKLRMQNATGQLTRPHVFKKLRREIAQLKTIIHEKQGKK